NRLSGVVSGFIGNNETFGEELVVSGISDSVSFSLGQFHSESDGFRSNNDVENDLYDAFWQLAISPKLGIQVEYIDRDSEFGDLVLGVDPDSFSEARTGSRDEKIGRVGLTYRPTSYLTSLFSWIHAEQEVGDFFSFPPSSTFQVDNDDQSDLVEAQVIGTMDKHNFVVGGSHSMIDADRTIVNAFGPVPIVTTSEDKLSSSNGYFYAYNNSIEELSITLGLAINQVEESNFENSRVHPKLGLEWQPLSMLRLRAAYFETMKKSQRTERTIEPTHVAGFNQLFDETNGTRSQTFGVGVDGTLSGHIKMGAEFTVRKQERPFISGGVADFHDERDDILTGYVYVPLGHSLALSLEPELRWFDSDEPLGSGAEETRTFVLPLGIRYFHQSGLRFGIDANWIRQDLEEFDNEPNASFDEEFVTIDAGLAYRLPKRRGIISLEIRNLLDERFGFQDDNFRSTREREPRFVPDRTYFARATFNF
ncbi:MAG: TonB-dependent receptor, partial [Alphaproteobacteria bacterium]|nr:TonB-dependent receptor [Alphaproteobacteria bacterium]